MFSVIFSQIIKMLLILFVGILCYRIRLIDKDLNAKLADLLLLVINPMVAFTSLQSTYSPELIHGLLISFAVAFLTHLIMIALSSFLIRKTGNENFAVERLSAMYSNCGFIGIPMVQSILGSEGVFYLSAYITVFNVLIWTHGVFLMTESGTGQKTKPGAFLKTAGKNLCSPMIIACLAGILFFCLQIHLPSLLLDAMEMIGSMNTPLAMIIAGAAVAQADLPVMLKNGRVYLITAVKLLLMPAIVFVLLLAVPAGFSARCTLLIAAACPGATTVTAFALRYGKNYTYASELYTFSTLLSMVTIPLFVYAAERLF